MSGADEKIRAVLERLILECLNCPQDPRSGYARDVRAVLERRLLPLLLAGQAMQERLFVLSDEVGASEAVSSMAWREALAAAQGQPEKESGR